MTPTVSHLISRSLTLLATLAIMLTAVLSMPAQTKQQREGPYKVGNGVTPPKVLYKVDPEYTQEDKDAKIEGPVILQIVVTTEGKAANIKVVKGVSSGLDEKAIEAIQKWTFQPGTKDGQAVDVDATVEVHFRLR